VLVLSLTLLTLTGQITAPSAHLLDAPVVAPSSEMAVSAAQLKVDLAALKRLRPGLGAPITLISVGGGIVGFGVIYVLLSIALTGVSSISTDFLVVLAGIAGAVGGPLLMVGIWLLVDRLEVRSRIEHESARLKRELSAFQRRDPVGAVTAHSMVLARF
jgi:hypothetical protein